MKTTALCSTCYKEISALAHPFKDDAQPTLYKFCQEHGLQKGVLEVDNDFYDCFNTYERRNHYDVLIINVTDTCNIRCKHCFYPIHNSWHMPLEQFKNTVISNRGRFSQFIISGGDPTCWEYYFEAAEWCRENNIYLSQLTNGIKFFDQEFWGKTKDCYLYEYAGQKYLAAEMSIHPSNITTPMIRDAQLVILQLMRNEKIKQSCIMINIDAPSGTTRELDTIMSEVVDFILEWQDVTSAFRIRPICFDAWGSNPNPGHKWHLSDLVKSLGRITRSRGIDMKYSNNKDVDNIYNQNFLIGGVNVVTVCAANIHDLDLGYLNRGPFMLANDGKPYSVPHCLIINEGIYKGYYGGCKC